MKKIILILITIFYIFSMKVYWNTVSADESYVDSQKILKEGDYKKALRYAKGAIEKNPNEPRYYYGRAKILIASTLEKEKEERQVVKSEALKDLKKAEALNPRNLVTLRNIVPLYYYLTIEDLSKESAENNLDQNFFEITKNYYERVRNFYPDDVGIYVLLDTYERKLELHEKHQENLENIRRLRPDLLDWYLN